MVADGFLRTFFRNARLLLAALFAVAALMQAPAARADVAAWLVMDLERGQVLDSQNAGRIWAPASITKMMTAYTVFRALQEGRVSLDTPVVMSKAADAVPYGMKFKAGVSMTLDDAIKMMIVKSANDVSHAIAEAVSGSEPAFVDEMNVNARRIGMTRSVWGNPHGLSESGQLTTARDMAVLTYKLWHDFPQYRPYFAVGAIQHGKKVYRSRNRLLGRYPGVNGMKTGYICDSGNNVVTTATRNGRTIAVITLGAAGFLERAVVTKSLMDRGFRKRFGGTPLGRFAATEGASLPPVSGYCKTWNKPKPAELLAQYGTQAKTAGQPVLSLFSVGDDDDPTKRVIGDDTEAQDVSVAAVLADVIGPDRGVVPVRVSTGARVAVPAVAMTIVPRPKPWGYGTVAAATPASTAPAAADPAVSAEGAEGGDGAIAFAQELRGNIGGVELSSDGPLTLPGVSGSGAARAGELRKTLPVVGTPAPGMAVPRPKPTLN